MTKLKLSTRVRKDTAYLVYETPDGASVYFPARAVVGAPAAEVTVSLDFGPVVRKAPRFLTDAEKLAEALVVVARLSPKPAAKPAK